MFVLVLGLRVAPGVCSALDDPDDATDGVTEMILRAEECLWLLASGSGLRLSTDFLIRRAKLFYFFRVRPLWKYPLRSFQTTRLFGTAYSKAGENKIVAIGRMVIFV